MSAHNTETAKVAETPAECRRGLLAEIEAQEAAIEKATADYKAAEDEAAPFRKRMRAATDRKWEAQKRLAQARADLTALISVPADDSMRPWIKEGDQ